MLGSDRIAQNFFKYPFGASNLENVPRRQRNYFYTRLSCNRSWDCTWFHMVKSLSSSLKETA